MIYKKHLLFGIFLTISTSIIAQNHFYLKFNSNPSLSWKSNESTKMNYVNSLGLNIGYELDKMFSLETGLGLNKIGYTLQRTVEIIGVIDGGNSYLLEGEIPVKQKFTEKFIEIPIQLNYKLKEMNSFNLTFYTRISLNHFKEDIHENWYYYKTNDEFMTKNTFIGTQGRNRFAYSYQIGMNFSKKLNEKIIFGLGFNYKNLLHNHKFPFLPEKRKFHNVGCEIIIIYNMLKKDD